MRVAIAALCALIAGCSSAPAFQGECTKNEDCPVGAFCKTTPGSAGGICACRTDEACAAGEVCNSVNVCQRRDKCRSNVECMDKSTFCDSASGDCIARTDCGTDVHCIPGTVCVEGMASCVDGCYSTSDCPLYSVCDRTGAGAGQLGHCLTGRCDDKTFCAYGSKCNNGVCQTDPNPNYCRDCTNTGDCGDPANYCLINSSYDPQNPRSGSQNFCGVDCRGEADCPSGYNCGGVILLTQDSCTQDNQCGGGGRQCILGEGDLIGFCTCVADNDCTLDQVPPLCQKSCSGLGLVQCTTNNDCASRNCVGSCLDGNPCNDDSQCSSMPLCSNGPLGQACLNTGLPCSSSDECLCSAGRCFGSGRPCSSAAQCRLTCQNGGCLLGSACAPIQGLLCPDVRP